MTATPSYWLVKSEPAKYAFSDLQRDGKTVWDGVRNHQAAIYLRAMRVGDVLFYYHSQQDLAVVGLATVSKEAFIDPSDPAGRFVAVEVSPLRPMARPVTLAAMKAEPALAGMKMFRQFRLSVIPVEPDEAKVILGLGGEAAT